MYCENCLYYPDCEDSDDDTEVLDCEYKKLRKEN